VRSYFGVYVDAGYLAAAASTRLTGTSYRAATEMDVAGLLPAITAQAGAHAELPLLRVHWYDAASRGVPSGEQRRIATLPRVKLRLGRTSVHGEQKGVDLKLALDLITQARNRVTDVVYLLSGDDDLTEAVEEAQYLGTQVVLLAVPDREGRPISVSRHLQMACDDLVLVDPAALDEYVRKTTASIGEEEPAAAEGAPTVGAAVLLPEGPPVRVTPAVVAALAEQRAPAVVPPKRLLTSPGASSTRVYSSDGSAPAAYEPRFDTEEAIIGVVTSLTSSWWLSATPGARSALLAGRPLIPQDLDRTLLIDLCSALGIDQLDTETRHQLRDAFWERVERL
jgi:uncharacterized LabA/DUF88 family protein